MRSMALTAMTAGSVYLWLHFRGLPIFEKLHISKGLTWVLSAALAAAMLLIASIANTVFTGFYLYLCLCYVLTDCFWIIALLAGREKRLWHIWRRIYAGGLTVMALAAIVAVGGYFNARHISVTGYEVDIPKAGSDGLQVAMISDIHLGAFLHGDDMPALAEKINALKPDIVLLGGDIYEESTSAQDIEQSLDAFSTLRATYGVFYVPGNHEYNAQRRGVLDLREIGDELYGSGVVPLKDETVSIGEHFTLVGRDDATVSSRKPLTELLQGVDLSKLVIILDHQPRDMEEAAQSGADIQLSGHTHAGQLFPAGELASISGVFPVVYGLKEYGSFRIIVSSGAGVWGFPMRVGSPSEIMLVTIKGINPNA